MWIAIIAVVDKLLSLAVSWLPWQLKRSDEKTKKQDEARKEMDNAVKDKDWDAYWTARRKRNRA